MTTPTVEAYAELAQAFDFFNAELFGSSLPPVLFTMQREGRIRGYFSRERWVYRTGAQMTDEIAMNPGFFATQELSVTLSTLVHEMCHQWQFVHGKTSRRGYHNSEWGQKMESVGLMPSSTARPGGKKTGEKVSHYIIPGGPYSQACSKLLTDTFRLSWYDRYPQQLPPDEAPIDTSPPIFSFVESDYPDGLIPGLLQLGDDPDSEGVEDDEPLLRYVLVGGGGGEDDGYEDGEFRAAAPERPKPEGSSANIPAALKGTIVLPKPKTPRSPKPRTENGRSSAGVKYRCPSCQTVMSGPPDRALSCHSGHCSGVMYERVPG